MEGQVSSFPSRREPSRWEVPLRGAAALSLRDAGADDLPYLRRLYAGSREPELAPIPWSAEAKRAFCDSQFDLQHRHYVTHFATAEFLVVMHGDSAIGRLYLHESSQELAIIDILLDEAMRGKGFGTALLGRLQQEVRDRGLAALSLHVLTTNAAARRLYGRLGFVVEGDATATHLGMRWRLPPTA